MSVVTPRTSSGTHGRTGTVPRSWTHGGVDRQGLLHREHLGGLGLGKGGSEHACDECGAKMFVRYSSGLCPQCFNGLRSARHAGPVVHVPFERALAGVLDDPAIEDARSE